MKASELQGCQLQRDCEQVALSSSLSWPSTGHQIHSMSLESLLGCPHVLKSLFKALPCKTVLKKDNTFLQKQICVSLGIEVPWGLV